MESTASHLESTHRFQQLLMAIGTQLVSVTPNKATSLLVFKMTLLSSHAGTIRATQSLPMSLHQPPPRPRVMRITTACLPDFSTIGGGTRSAQMPPNLMLTDSSSLTKTTERAGQLETPLKPSHSTGMPRSTKTTPDLFSQAQQLWQPEELHFSQQS